jgi:hypothetical protein
LVDGVAESLPAFDAECGELVWGQEVGDFEVGFGGVGHQGKRVMRFAEESSGLPVWEVAASAAHEFGEDDKGRQVGFASTQITEDGTGVGALDASGEAASGLHDLPTGVVDGGAVMVAGADEGEFVCDGCVFGEDFGDLDFGGFGLDGFEGASDFCGGVGLHIPEVDMAGAAEIEEENAGAVVFGFVDLTCCEGCLVLGEGETDGGKGSDLKELAAFEVGAAAEAAVAGDGGEEVDHTEVGTGERVRLVLDSSRGLRHFLMFRPIGELWMRFRFARSMGFDALSLPVGRRFDAKNWWVFGEADRWWGGQWWYWISSIS